MNASLILKTTIKTDGPKKPKEKIAILKLFTFHDLSIHSKLQDVNEISKKYGIFNYY